MATEESAPEPQEPTRPSAGNGPAGSGDAAAAQLRLRRPLSAWRRIKEHKVVQWTVAYGVAAYTLLHIVQMVSDALDWSHLVVRIVTLCLFLGVPVAATLAWYHGHRALSRISGPELAILTVLLLIAATVLWFLGKPTHEQRAARQGAQTLAPGGSVAPASAATAKSIAVLPFVDMSEQHDQEYFGDGMAEEILGLLASIPELTVIGRTSSFQFKGRGEDLRTIGEKLGVAYVVEGSVRKAGARLRVTAQLIDTQSGAHVWSDSYDRDFGDVLALQNEIAAGIARALQLAVTADVGQPTRRVANREAYALYLRGLALLDRQHEQQLLAAKQILGQALALDPSFLRAAEALALVHIAMGLDEDVPSRSAWREAKAAAEHSLQIDANSACAHGVLGFVRDYDEFACDAAETEIAKAFALNARDPATLYLAAQVSFARGRRDEALSRINASLALDPLNPYAVSTQGALFAMLGDLAGSERAYRRVVAIIPTFDGSHYALSLVALLRGEPAAALAEVQSEYASDAKDLGLALAYQALGRRSESTAALTRLTKADADLWPFGIGLAHAYRGESDDAVRWLEKAYESRDADFILFALSHPLLEPLRSDSRFKALIRKMNLPD
jgi:TolB-like protein